MGIIRKNFPFSAGGYISRGSYQRGNRGPPPPKILDPKILVKTNYFFVEKPLIDFVFLEYDRITRFKVFFVDVLLTPFTHRGFSHTLL